MAITSAELLCKFEQPIVVPPVGEFHNASYINCVTQSFQVFVDIYQNTGKSFFDLTTFLNNCNTLLSKYNKDLFSYCVWIVFGTLVLTLVRSLINRIVLNLLFKYKLLKPTNAARFSESVCSLTYYLIAFTLEYSIERDNHFLVYPEKFWINFDLSRPFSASVKILYLIQCSYYLNCLGRLFFSNPWNSKDYAIVVFHHFLALAYNLLGTLSKILPLGVSPLYLSDFCSVFLEIFKGSSRLELNNKLLKKIVTFVLFVLLFTVWCACRLYYFPMRFVYPLVLYLNHNPVESWVPFIFGIFALSGFTFLMNAYWTVVMIIVLFKALRGEQIGDIREPDMNANDILVNEDKMKNN